MQSPPLSPRAEEMRTLLARYERGESTLAELAAEAAVKRSTLIWWRSRLRMLSRTNASTAATALSAHSAFVELTRTPDPAASPSADLIIELDAMRFRIPHGFDAQELRRLLEALR
jgi:hypothetical protein